MVELFGFHKISSHSELHHAFPSVHSRYIQQELLRALPLMSHAFRGDENRLHAADIIPRGYKHHAKIWRRDVGIARERAERASK